MGVQRIPRPEFDATTEAFCTKCRNVKPHAAFPKSKNTRTGLHGWCSTCNNAGIKAWEDAHYEHRRDYQARQYRMRKAAEPVRPFRRRNVARYQPIKKSA